MANEAITTSKSVGFSYLSLGFLVSALLSLTVLYPGCSIVGER